MLATAEMYPVATIVPTEEEVAENPASPTTDSVWRLGIVTFAAVSHEQTHSDDAIVWSPPRVDEDVLRTMRETQAMAYMPLPAAPVPLQDI